MSEKKTILFVDDEPQFLAGLRDMLRKQRNEWRMYFAVSVAEALALIEKIDFDTIVSDVSMPVRSGFDLLRELKATARTRDLPIIILTGNSDHDLKRKALDLGATDLLSKPVYREDLLARINNALRLKAYEDELRNQNVILDRRVRERTRDLEISRMNIVFRLAKAGEYRDEETGYHIVRVGCYSRVLAKAFGLGRELTDRILLASPLHDIGKIGVPDAILLKQGRLTEDEWQVMRSHCQIGYHIFMEEFQGMDIYSSRLGLVVDRHQKNPFLLLAAEIALNHHEKWNGSGYPRGISGEQIPIAARIVALADVYDALRSERPYKKAFDEEKTYQIIAEGAGSHFDPAVFEKFLENRQEFDDIYHELMEPTELMDKVAELML